MLTPMLQKSILHPCSGFQTTITAYISAFTGNLKVHAIQLTVFYAKPCIVAFLLVCTSCIFWKYAQYMMQFVFKY